MALEVYDAFGDWKRARQGADPTAHVAFVPTMGALHQGHADLIRRAQQEVGPSGHVVVSIYVNPTQFNDAADFEAYPNTREVDLRMAESAGADAVVFPQPHELYPGGVPQRVPPVDYGGLTALWEAAHRPGHFDGVVAVVRALFRQVEPNRAYFGEKDWQQLAVVSELVRREFPDLTIVPVPTRREEDGLAMSSRNVRLDERERGGASMLHAALKAVAAATETVTEVRRQSSLLEQAGWSVEYLAVVDSVTLDAHWELGRELRAIGAAHFGGVRFIDNVPVPN
jgi:pantoate--beta-alanine ligase